LSADVAKGTVRLSAEPLFDADGQIRRDVSFAQLAEFVWFAETGTGFTGPARSWRLNTKARIAGTGQRMTD
jgi:hypothetical protein